MVNNQTSMMQRSGHVGGMTSPGLGPGGGGGSDPALMHAGKIHQRNAAAARAMHGGRHAGVLNDARMFQLSSSEYLPPQQSMMRHSLVQLHYHLVAINMPLESKLLLAPTRTENSLAYVIPTSPHDYHLYSFCPRTVREWNYLPQVSVLLGTPEAFRSALASV